MLVHAVDMVETTVSGKALIEKAYLTLGAATLTLNK